MIGASLRTPWSHGCLLLALASACGDDLPPSTATGTSSGTTSVTETSDAPRPCASTAARCSSAMRRG